MAASSTGFRAVLRIALAGFAAFAVYFCMYGFRKPFAVASWEHEAGLGDMGLKTLLEVERESRRSTEEQAQKLVSTICNCN